MAGGRVLNHLDGLELIYKLRTQFSHELELVCLNSEYQDITPLLLKAQFLQAQFPDQVVIKESETHDSQYPYYEVSLFCNQEDVEKFTKTIEDAGLQLDIIHETKDQWSPY